MTSHVPRRWPRGLAGRTVLGGAALGVAALAAAAVSAGAQQPTPPAPAAPSTAQPSAAQPSAARELSLEEAVQLGERQSESVRIARASVLRARGQQYQARSQLFPQLNTTLAYQRTLKSQFQEIGRRFSQPSNGTGGGDAVAESPLTRIFASPNTIIFGLTGSQNLFAGGRLLSGAAAAGAGRRAADVGLLAVRTQVTLDVTQAYYDAALADRLVAIAESSLVQTERTWRQAALARQVGNTSEFEALRARVTRDNQRPQVIQARTNRDVAYLRLRQLLDLPLSQTVRLTTSLGDDAPSAPAPALAAGPAAVPVVPAVNAPVSVDDILAEDSAVTAAVSEALTRADTTTEHRSSVRQARENAAAARYQLRAARGERLPALQLSTNYQRYSYPEGGIPGLHDFFPNWTVSVGLSLPIFTGGRIRGSVMSAQANYQQAQAQLEQARELAALDAQLALAQLEQASASYAASAGTSSQAARAYQIAEVRYREGVSTQVELNDSRLLLQQAQANRAQAARELQVARVRLALLRDLPVQAGVGAGQQTTQQQGSQQLNGGQQQGQQQGTSQGSQSAGAGQTQTGQFGGNTP
jgi:outer membrane protein TolC